MDDQFETFAQKMCEYNAAKFTLPYMREHGAVQSYRAAVVSKNAAAGTMVIQRPFDQQITLPYAPSADILQAGDECLVLVFGESSNAIIVSDGALRSFGGGIVRPNILDNWYFVGGGSQQGGGQFPINQRGKTSYSYGYTVDRLYNRSSNVQTDVATDGIKFTNLTDPANTKNMFINEALECRDRILGQTVTLSVLVAEVSNSAEARIQISNANAVNLNTDNLGSSQWFTSPGLYSVTVTIPNTVTYSYIHATMLLRDTSAKNSYIVVKAWKLELGDTQTLAHLENGEWVLNELPNYQEQLARCQRHLYIMNTYGATDARFAMGQTMTGTTADFLIEPPVPMRTVPTLTTSGSLAVIRASNSYTATYAIDSTGSTNDRILVVATRDSSTWTTSNPCQLKADNDATSRLIFSAEL